MAQASVLDQPWYIRAFERIYLRLYAHRNDAEARGHVQPIMDLLGLRAGDRVLDIACGAGRHARALAARGLRVTGVDLSEDLLEEAREASPNLPGTPDYLRWDIRDLPLRGQFEGAISMFTSFGYFEDREDDLSIMEGAHRALVPGGRFLLDFLNEAQVRAKLVPFSDTEADGLRVRVERRIDDDAPGGPRVYKAVHVQSTDTRLVETSFEEQVRLYTPAEIDELLADAGLRPVGDPLGEFDRRPFTAESPRYIRVAERPAGRR
ncbi:MAG: class I SAM-dependent methyltransferase [Planctomycetota bacterium]|jgi:SAM-dependent methyltransferase